MPCGAGLPGMRLSLGISKTFDIPTDPLELGSMYGFRTQPRLDPNR